MQKWDAKVVNEMKQLHRGDHFYKELRSVDSVFLITNANQEFDKVSRLCLPRS